VTGRREFLASGVLPLIGQAPTPEPPALAEWESFALATMRRLGEREACDRLYLAGAYGVIALAIQRLGTDAIRELRRLALESEGWRAPG
jgi:hypothetical protein